ncbi:hypothetical protein AHF37_02010 [Paragonimus kellicotti]|nr:hypothetical protein AHF37_02010 [Paragonimus kellicotti]
METKETAGMPMKTGDTQLISSSTRPTFNSINNFLFIKGFAETSLAYFRDRKGRPRTPRDPRTGQPALGKDRRGNHVPSNSTLVIKENVFVSTKSSTSLSVPYLTLPTIVNLARKYFDASSLDGVPLEREEHMTSQLEARIFPEDIMVVGGSLLTNFTLAFLYDTGHLPHLNLSTRFSEFSFLYDTTHERESHCYHFGRTGKSSSDYTFMEFGPESKQHILGENNCQLLPIKCAEHHECLSPWLVRCESCVRKKGDLGKKCRGGVYNTKLLCFYTRTKKEVSSTVLSIQTLFVDRSFVCSRSLPTMPFCTWPQLTTPACYPDRSAYGYCDIRQQTGLADLHRSIDDPRSMEMVNIEVAGASAALDYCPILEVSTVFEVSELYRRQNR